MRKIISIIIISVIAIFLALGTTAFINYYNIEAERLITRQEEVIALQEREIVFLANTVFLQIAYTEHLKIILELNDVQYERYMDFLERRIFRQGELDAPDFLYDNVLDLDTLLLKATHKGGLIEN